MKTDFLWWVLAVLTVALVVITYLLVKWDRRG